MAVFNAGEEEKTVEFSNKDIGLTEGEHEVEFVWENKIELLEKYSFTLSPHESLLIKIKE